MTIAELQELRSAKELAHRLNMENMALKNELHRMMAGDPETEAQDREVLGMVARRDRAQVIEMERIPHPSAPPALTPSPEGKALIERVRMKGDWMEDEFVDYRLPERKEPQKKKASGFWAAAMIGEVFVNGIYRMGWIGIETALAFGMIVLGWAGLYAI